MMGLASLARCCCNCEDCCNGAYPTEFDVTIPIVDSHCTTCNETLAGTFTLGLSAPAGGLSVCRWGYTRAFGFYTDICQPAGPYDPYGGWYLTTQQVYLRVTCINATQYLVRVWMIIGAVDRGTLRGISNWYEWSKYVDVADWPCDGVADYCLPFSFRSWSGNQAGTGPWFAEGAYPPGEVWLCDTTGVEACVTAVP